MKLIKKKHPPMNCATFFRAQSKFLDINKFVFKSCIMYIIISWINFIKFMLNYNCIL